MTQFKPLFFCILICFIGVFAIGINAQHNHTSILVITTFDYPGAGNSTTPFGINERGDIVGDYVDSAGVRRGFRRRIDGSFTTIVPPGTTGVPPGQTGTFTRAHGINNPRTIVGDFFNGPTNAFHGYFLNGTTFSQYDIGVIGGPFSTEIFGINDDGNFVGIFGSSVQHNRGYVNIGGTAAIVTIPAAFDSEADAINKSNRVVGTYRDAGLLDHGFIRSSNGTLTNPVDFPGAHTTLLRGINSQGSIVGRYTDASGHEHGLFRKNANTYVSFDYPNSFGTSLNGINDFGFIVGRYTDAAGIRHGFVAWVRGGGDDDDDDD